MPFPGKIKETALVKSRRCCCVCHEQAGLYVEVHHIVQEADGGANDLENAIVLCFRCHAEAGHYNPRHPRGTKYSPSELRKHRDAWWKYYENYDYELRPKNHDNHPLNRIPNGQDIKLVEKEIGTLWSNYANYPVKTEIVRFKGQLIAECTIYKDSLSPHSYELYQISDGRYIVYHNFIHRADYGCAKLIGANLDINQDPPLTLEHLQTRFPELATEAGLSRIRVIEL
ncbi:MAG: HNH endonuclease [Nodularia sp. CChRGM 3473]